MIQSDESYVKEFKKNYLFNQSLLGKADKEIPKLHADVDGTDLEIFKFLSSLDMKEFVDKGRNLFLYSNITGNGKTAWAKKLLINWFDDIAIATSFECRGLFIDVQKMLNSIRDSIKNHNDYYEFIKANVLTADLVVWDDVGVKKLGDWEHEFFLMYINTRISEGKANIFTSNFIDAPLRNLIGDRLYSRIVNNSKLIEFKGKDKRTLNKW